MRSLGNRLSWLVLIDSLAVSLSRQIISRRFSESLGGFLEFWLIHFMGVVLFAVIAGACLAHFRKFWLKGQPGAERAWTNNELIFAVLMTILVAAIFAAVVAGATPADLDDQS
jgi:hypothetical protein